MIQQSLLQSTGLLIAFIPASGLAQSVLLQSDGIGVHQHQIDEATISLLAIGISQYEKMPDLVFTTNDAIEVSKAFSQVGGLTKDNMAKLIDIPASRQSRIDRAMLMQRLARFLSKQRQDSTAVLFFSGHGFQDKASFYLVPSDFSPESPETTGISLVELRGMLTGCKAKTKIVILDCCHSGSFGSTPTDTKQLASTFRAVPGCVALTASRSDQQSLETDQLKAGVFSHWLVRGLRGAANQNMDGAVDVVELFEFTSKGVKQSTQGRQSPSISMDQFDEIPKVMTLKSPDRPSSLVGVIAFPLPPSPQTMSTVIDTISHFPEANPRRTIGICHWVQKHSKVGSAPYQQATALIKTIDTGILSGKYRLAEKDPKEQPWQSQRPD